MTRLREDALNESKVYYVALVTGHRTWTTRERPVSGLDGILEFTDTHGDKISVPQLVVWVRSRGLEGFPERSVPKETRILRLLQSQPEGDTWTYSRS
jgi:hypothetical protein